MSKFLTKKQTISLFLSKYNRSDYNGNVGDTTWRAAAWLDFIYDAWKDNQISEAQYNDWTDPNPFADKYL